MAWNGLTSDSIIRPGQQLFLRITPPATTTPIPAQPSATAAITQTPVSLTPTQEVTLTPPTVTAAAGAETQRGLYEIGVLLVVVLLAAML